jgi:GNAT superfamily N-acetyltransferase
MSDTEIHFSIVPPGMEALKNIFKSVEWDTSTENLRAIIIQRPHPSMTSLWLTMMRNGFLVGVATLYLPPPQALAIAPVFIGNFVIQGDSHRVGLGSLMLEEIERWCEQMQVRQLALQTVEASTPFFMAKGFIRNPDHPDVYMKTIG